MHRISDVRMGGTSLLSFRIFRELCGNESLCNALIVTTMWSLVDPKLGESREQELATTDDLFKPALDHGAQLVRHDGTLESAQNILRHLITNKSTTLRIQRELVDEGRVLSDTSAGAELVCHFAEQAGRLEARSRKLHKQMNDPFLAQDEEGRAMLQIELEEMQRGERRIEDEIERLRKMTSSAIDTHSDWVTIESVEHPLGNLQVELPTKEQVRTALQEQFSRLQERLQNEAYLQSRSRELEDEQKRVEYARRIAEETQEMQRRNDVMLQEEERHQERSEIPYLILCGAVILKVFEFIAYTVF
ncbi:hypothetical protein J3R82DRAFT_7279 [Butyriboletus roseoflavus]|nr:hypothetical protein J3R82DRAFT_7279 [Butyriboletus roseoflavus]